ncbi:phiSA1p31-related protein [Streptomyces sp. bgisy032]|uniref:phiSA1p31-related protein n=1 Tax=Streptomyces sp. bgisy032 TaxID=3413773 RepID=UPI003D71D1DC
MAQFNTGDKVKTDVRFVPAGTIAFGPYRSVSGTYKYLVQREDGTTVPVPVDRVKPAPAFAVGDLATERAMGQTVEVVAGPFLGAAGQDRYVIKRPNGVHSFVSEATLTPRQAEPIRTLSGYTYRGRTYSLDGEYADRQGDVWRFNGKFNDAGMPMMNCDLYASFCDWTLADLVNSYGPLSRA